MQLGKPKREVLGRTVWHLSGAKSRDVISGPSAGIDVSVLRLGNGRVMLANCDPISLLPSIGPADSARMSVYEVASDIATTGHTPTYAMFDLNLPPSMSDRALTEYWRSIHKSCSELGVTIIGGHTGRFEGCDYSIIGAATLWTHSENTEYLTSNMAEDGDDLIITKTAAFGATSVLTRAFPQRVRKALGPALFEKARDYFRVANTVKDAITAASIGIHDRGVTAMHDATEGGVIAAILEIAEASGLGGTIGVEEIAISEETDQICKLFRIDPLVSLGEGTLVIACKPHRSKAVIDKLRSKKIAATIVGRLSSRTPAVYKTDRRGRTPLIYPRIDPYWNAYWRALERGWA